MENLQQVTTLLLAVAMGIGLCLLFDLFRLFRLAFPAGKMTLFFQDVFYWVICALVVFCFLIIRCAGEPRSFVFVGGIAGWIACRFTLSRFIMKICTPIIFAFRAAFRWLRRRVWRPAIRQISRFFDFLNEKIKKLGIFILKFIKKWKKHLKRPKDVVYNQEKGQVIMK